MTPVDDELAALGRYADELVAAVHEALGPWLERAVTGRYPGSPPDEMVTEARAAGERARDDVTPRLRELLTLDIDAQWTNPLSIIRSAVVHANEVLAAAGVPPAERDAHDARINPDDVYAIAPAAFADLGPRAHEAGLVWGAAKAHVHLKRHKANERASSCDTER